MAELFAKSDISSTTNIDTIKKLGFYSIGGIVADNIPYPYATLLCIPINGWYQCLQICVSTAGASLAYRFLTGDNKWGKWFILAK